MNLFKEAGGLHPGEVFGDAGARMCQVGPLKENGKLVEAIEFLNA